MFYHTLEKPGIAIDSLCPSTLCVYFKNGKRESLTPDLIPVVFFQLLMSKPPHLFKDVSNFFRYKVCLGHCTNYDDDDNDDDNSLRLIGIGTSNPQLPQAHEKVIQSSCQLLFAVDGVKHNEITEVETHWSYTKFSKVLGL